LISSSRWAINEAAGDHPRCAQIFQLHCKILNHFTLVKTKKAAAEHCFRSHRFNCVHCVHAHVNWRLHISSKSSIILTVSNFGEEQQYQSDHLTKRGRLFLLASWLVIRLRWAIAYTKTSLARPGDGGSINKARIVASGNTVPSKWFLADDAATILTWHQDDHHVHVYTLSKIVRN